jgi:hypothetical protein
MRQGSRRKALRQPGTKAIEESKSGRLGNGEWLAGKEKIQKLKIKKWASWGKW